MVRLRFFGPFGASTSDGAELRFETSKSAQILARTVSSRGHKTTRDELCAWLWPDSDGERAKSSLRSALSALRRTFSGHRIFESDTSEVWAIPRSFESDLELAESLFSRCLQAQGYALSDLLTQFIELVDHDFCATWDNEWADQQRKYWRARWASGAERLVGLLTQDESWEKALTVCQRLLADDPYSEFAAGTAVQCLSKLGKRAAAIQIFEHTVALLRTDLGCEPSRGFLEVGAMLKTGSSEPVPHTVDQSSAPGGRDAFRLVEDALATDPDGALALMRSTGLRPSSYVDLPATLQLLERVLAATSGFGPDRLQVIYCAAVFSGFLNLNERLRELCETLLEHSTGDPLMTSRVLLATGFAAFESRDWEEADRLSSQAREIGVSAGLDSIVASAETNLASFAWHQLRFDEARESYAKQIERFSDGSYMGNMYVAITKCNLGHLETAAGNWQRALEAFEAGFGWGVPNLDRKVLVYSCSGIGYSMVRLGAYEGAADYLQRGLLAAHEGHLLRFRDLALEHIGMSLVLLKRPEGVWVIDAADRARALCRHSRSPAEEKTVSDALATLSDAEVSRARSMGFAQDLPINELVERAHRLAEMVRS